MTGSKNPKRREARVLALIALYESDLAHHPVGEALGRLIAQTTRQHDDSGPAAGPVDDEAEEAIAAPGFLGVRRTPLEAPVRALAADARGGPYVLAQSADGAWLLINLDVRRAIARYVINGGRE